MKQSFLVPTFAPVPWYRRFQTNEPTVDIGSATTSRCHHAAGPRIKFADLREAGGGGDVASVGLGVDAGGVGVHGVGVDASGVGGTHEGLDVARVVDDVGSAEVEVGVGVGVGVGSGALEELERGNDSE